MLRFLKRLVIFAVVLCLLGAAALFAIAYINEPSPPPPQGRGQPVEAAPVFPTCAEPVQNMRVISEYDIYKTVNGVRELHKRVLFDPGNQRYCAIDMSPAEYQAYRNR
jgi:hypothetical protein